MYVTRMVNPNIVSQKNMKPSQHFTNWFQELSHYMVTDMVSILASVGGALGLCLGFSLWGGFNTGCIIGTTCKH